MKNNIPSDDSRAMKKTVENLDWDKVAFKKFSGEVCKHKWMQMSNNLNKSLTPSELVHEASELIKDSRKSKTVKKHPDIPKRPLTAYLRFYKEQREKYSKMYPNYNNVQLTKILTEKYKQLPEGIKKKYIQDFQKEMQVFQEKLTKFRENHPRIEHSKKSVVPRNHQTASPKKSLGDRKRVKSPLKTEIPKTFPPVMKFRGEPKKPPMNGYHKFHQDSWSSQELHHLPLRQLRVEISRWWQRISQNKRDQYNIQAEALQKQYWVEMDLWLKGLSPEEYAAYKETRANYGKRKNFAMSRDISPNGHPKHQQYASAKELQVGSEEMQGLLPPRGHSRKNIQGHDGDSQEIRKNVMEDSSNSSDSNSSSDSSSADEGEDNGHLP